MAKHSVVSFPIAGRRVALCKHTPRAVFGARVPSGFVAHFTDEDGTTTRLMLSHEAADALGSMICGIEVGEPHDLHPSKEDRALRRRQLVTELGEALLAEVQLEDDKESVEWVAVKDSE